MNGPYHGDSCDQDVEPVLVEDPLGDTLFPGE